MDNKGTEIYVQYLHALEKTFKPVDIFTERKDNFPNINAKMYTVLVDWLISVAKARKMSYEELATGVYFLHLALSKVDYVERSKLQLFGAVCLCIGEQSHAEIGIDIADYVYFGAGAFSVDEFKMERTHILKLLDLNTIIATPYSFLCLYLTSRYGSLKSGEWQQLLKKEDKNYTETLYSYVILIMNNCLVDYNILALYKPSIIAQNVIYLADKLTGYKLRSKMTNSSLITLIMSTTQIKKVAENKYGIYLTDFPDIKIDDEQPSVQLPGHKLDIIREKCIMFEEERFKKCYRKEKELGSGTFGTVYLATVLVDGLRVPRGEKVVFKQIRRGPDDDDDDFDYIEPALLKQTFFPNIVSLYDYALTEKYLYLILGVASFNLRDFIRCDKPLSIDKIRYILIQILLGVAYLHNRNIIHRDLKPANILVFPGGLIKIADFGSAISARPVLFRRTLCMEVQTLWWRAPELIDHTNKDYGKEIDMWSVGCIFGELLSGEPLFPADSEVELRFMISRLRGPPPYQIKLGQYLHQKGEDLSQKFPNLDKNGVNLLEGLLDLNYKTRLTANQALRHPFFR